MPLIAYFGKVSRRSPQALQKRETESIRRNWGPTPGGNRSRQMQEQGKGLAPSVLRQMQQARAAEEAAASAAAEQTKGQMKGQSSSDVWGNHQWSNSWSGGAWWSS